MIIVLASGSGTNFQVLAEAFPQDVGGLVCNIAGAGCFERAAKLGIKSLLVPHAGIKNRATHEKSVVEAIATLANAPQKDGSLKNLSLVVLAGYMRILTPCFFEEMERRFPGVPILNLHPAHLDEYKGPSAYEYAVEGKFPRWGLTVHHVIPELDAGPIVATREVHILPWESPTDLHSRVRAEEHSLLVSAVRLLLQKSPHPQTTARKETSP